MRLPGGLLLALFTLTAGTETRSKPGDYPVQKEIGNAVWGFEYNVRSVGSGNTSFIVGDYLVVEVAVFPKPGQTVDMNAQRLTLRINGKKEGLLTQAPAMVSASLKYPDWSWRRQTQVQAGAGDAGVILGRPQQVPRFPGDNRPAQTRLPGPVPRVPADAGAPEGEPFDPAQFIANTALPEGRFNKPVSGYVYFPYKGKLEKIKTVELIVAAGEGEGTVIRLR